MAEDQAARVERLKKAHLELQEKHAKSCDNISQVMKMLKMLTREKQSAEAPNSQTETTKLRGTGEYTPYQQGFALPRDTPTTYASLAQAFPLNYGPLQVVGTFGLVIHEPKIGADPVDPLAVLDFDELVEKGKSHQDKALEKYELLKERMRAMEGISILGCIDAVKLSLVLGLVIPHKFKTLTFDKSDGTKCPTTHLMMYYRKISAYTDNDKLLIYCFQDNLMGIAVQWYLKLDRTHIQSSEDLTRAFLTQHKHTTDFTPDRLSF